MAERGATYFHQSDMNQAHIPAATMNRSASAR